MVDFQIDIAIALQTIISPSIIGYNRRPMLNPFFYNRQQSIYPTKIRLQKKLNYLKLPRCNGNHENPPDTSFITFKNPFTFHMITTVVLYFSKFRFINFNNTIRSAKLCLVCDECVN